ncbi:MAG: glycosyltransferase family 4 protein [Acidobacteriia bacterium]|nr:glycosyltransferase family 4 protein [Terriglobia bacterium]
MQATAQPSDRQVDVRPVRDPCRRIVILNQAFYPDVVSTAQHATDLALALVEAGYQVIVVAGARAYDDPSRVFPARETWRGIEIIRVGSTRFGKTARWRRAADFATYMAACAVRLSLLRRCDLVIALTSPPLISWLGSLMVPLKARALLFWAMDLNPDEAIAAGWLRADSFTGRTLAAVQMQSMRRAAAIVALDRFMRERMISKGLPAEKIAVVPPWTHDPARFDATRREQFRAAHGLSGKFVVMYSGNHSPCHPLDTVVEAAQRLAADPRIVFCFAGGGSEYRRLQALAGERGMTNIVFLPYQPLPELGSSLSAADLQLVVMGDPFVGIIHPCKIYNVLRVGAPVLYIGPAESHIADLFASLGSGLVRAARHGDVDAVVAHILAAVEKDRVPAQRHIDFAGNYSRQFLARQMVAQVDAVCAHLRAT